MDSTNAKATDIYSRKSTPRINADSTTIVSGQTKMYVKVV
jgi:hypothetical protein